MEPQNEKEHVHKNTTNPISLPAAILSGAVIIAIALIVAFGPKKVADDAPTSAGPAEITEVPAAVALIKPDDHVRGDIATATVAIIEYSDSDCPYCSKFHSTMQQLQTEYAGKVAWVYRHFPLISLHPNAVTEAVALECAAELGGNSAFNTYLDTVINVTLNPDPKSNEALTTYATNQGIDAKLFKTCMASTAASDRVKADADEAQRIGAQGTPFSIVVNIKTGEQKIIPGAYPIEDMREAIAAVLK